MLSFETALALKEKGFPQVWPDEYGDSQARVWAEGIDGRLPRTIYWVQQDEVDDDTFCDGEYRILCKEPTIEDLIRELGARFGGLYQNGMTNFFADSWRSPEKSHSVYATPEEALANLWLSLHP